MHILVITESSDGQNVKRTIGCNPECGMESVLFGEVHIAFLPYKRGPKAKIESRVWDKIIITQEAYFAIGHDEFTEKWYPACAAMSEELVF